MTKLKNILEGWSKTMGIMKVPKEQRDLSNARLVVCSTSGPDGGACELAKADKTLMVIHSVFHNVGIIKCTGCGCPINEKSQVPAEACPLGKWPTLESLKKQLKQNNVGN